MSSNKKKKYVVAVMQKHYMGENSFIYSMLGVSVGTIDLKTDIFRDSNGHEYASMLDLSLMFSEVPYAYCNPVCLSELKEYVEKDVSIKEAINVYEDMLKDSFYYVGVDDDNLVYSVSITQDMIKRILTGDDALMPCNISPDSCDSLVCRTNEMDSPDYVSNVIMDVIDRKFDIDELNELKYKLQFRSENLEDLLNAIDLQIETLNYEQYPKDIDQIMEEAIKKVSSEKENEKLDASDSKDVDELIDIDELYQKVTKTLIAQDEPARRMIVEIAKMVVDNSDNNGILLTGSTGVGKTKLMNLIAENVDRPLMIIDSTQLTAPGYVGKSIEEALWELYIKCGKDKKKTEKAIVFFDEIDKKGSSRKSDVSGRAVLNVLLKFLDGTIYSACENQQLKSRDTMVNIDTSNMIVVAGGAFSDVYKHINDTHFGFATDGANLVEEREPTVDDFVEKAMMPDEFMGRFPIIIHLDDLTQDSMKRILLESDESPLKKEQKCFSKFGVKLSATEDYIDSITKVAYERKTGARGLKSMIINTTWRPFDEVSCHRGEYEEVLLDSNTVEDNHSYQLVKKMNNNLKTGNN